jgi:RNA 2',3'-cyclic 3'-phosphodiesterase
LRRETRISNSGFQDASVTNSNDTDPKISSESDGAEDAIATPAAEETAAPEANSETSSEDKQDSNPDWLIATGDDEPTKDEVEVGESESPEASEEESADGWIPTEVGERDKSRGEMPYYGGINGNASGYTRLSEATYKPSDPKIYRAPDYVEGDDDEQFGFPEAPENTERLFIAVEIPRKYKREFLDLANSFRPGEYERVRWIAEDAMHLTLKFLGDTPQEQIVDIKNALNLVAEMTGKFTIKIGRTGCFPSFRDPRICWVGFDGEQRRMEQLQGRVEGQLTGLGLKEDDRDFKAHITVGRTRPGIRGRFAEDIGISWQHAPLRNSGTSIPVNAIALYRSFLNEQGNTEYQQMANYTLG